MAERKKKSVLFIILFVVVLGVLLTAATFTDLQISQLLTKGVLEPGHYYSNNVPAVFFEILGDIPFEFFMIFSLSVMFIYALRFMKDKAKTAVMLVSGVVNVVFGYVTCSTAFGRIKTHLLYGLDVELSTGKYLELTYIFFGVVFACLGILAVNNFSDDSIKKLLPFSFATIAFSLASTIAINIGIKDFVGRIRFRAMNVNPDDETFGFSAFTRWYEIQRSISDDVIVKVFGSTDARKSFPSGHAGSAGCSYAMVMFNDVFNRNKKRVRVLNWVIPIVFTGAVAVSRIAIGAHFMSDVLAGGTLSFVLMIIAREIFVLKGANVKALFNK